MTIEPGMLVRVMNIYKTDGVLVGTVLRRIERVDVLLVVQPLYGESKEVREVDCEVIIPNDL